MCKPAADGMGTSCSTCGVVDRNDPRGMNCSNGFHAPTAEMLSEREQEAWEIYLAGDMAAFPASRPPKRTPTIAAFSLAARDRAEAIFTAKSEERVKRVEQERDEARAETLNPEAVALGGGAGVPGIGAADLRTRVMDVMTNEARLCLKEGVIRDSDDVDFALISGAGFPAFRGGLLWQTQERT